MKMSAVSHYNFSDSMFSFRFLIALCLGFMLVAYGSAGETDAQQTSLLDQQKKAVETVENNSNKSNSSKVVDLADGPKNATVPFTPYSGSMSSFIPNKAALIRSTYVFGGLCFLAILYFAFRTCRLRRRRGSASSRRTGTRKYRPLHSGGAGSQEMEPLGDGDIEDEDEDTLFDTAQPSSAARPSLGV